MSATGSVKVALDAMGGDNAPAQIVKGAVLAVQENKDINVVLVGREEDIKKELAQYEYPKDQISIHNAAEVISTEEEPAMAVRRKKDSSLCVAARLVKDGEADALVSAGSTGALVVAGLFIVGRLKGVERAPLATLIPTIDGVSILIDTGANADARASQLVQFAKMGSVYYESVMNVEKPRVGLVNIGTEAEKGNALAKETYKLLSECSDINFTGNLEPREIPYGGADVIVTDGFTGNVILKLYEGTSTALVKKIKAGLMVSARSKVGALLIKPALKQTMKSFDSSGYGGAPLLGLRGLVVKTHGMADATEVKNTLVQCRTFKEQDINGRLATMFCEKEGEEG